MVDERKRHILGGVNGDPNSDESPTEREQTLELNLYGKRKN